MDLDLSQVPTRFRAAFQAAERSWENRLIGWSDELPRAFRNTLGKVRITAVVSAIDGPGGVLGSATVTQTASFSSPNVGNRPGRNYAVAQRGAMNFDVDDIDFYLQSGRLEGLVFHEMGHALGFAPLWAANNLRGPSGFDYIGYYGLREYRKETNNPGALSVPLERQGGGGTAGGHWDSADPFFLNSRRQEVMIGIDFGLPEFISNTTWGSMADLWYKVLGINSNLTTVPPPRPGPGLWPPKSGTGPVLMRAIPEPTSAAVLFGLALTASVFGRRRRD